MYGILKRPRDHAASIGMFHGLHFMATREIWNTSMGPGCIRSIGRNTLFEGAFSDIQPSLLIPRAELDIPTAVAAVKERRSCSITWNDVKTNTLYIESIFGIGTTTPGEASLQESTLVCASYFDHISSTT
jgi:hypothetical protein